MQTSYVEGVVSPDQHYVSGRSDIGIKEVYELNITNISSVH